MTARPANDLRQYDDLSAEWWDPHGALALLHWIAVARARLVPPAQRAGAVLLDVGCGGGLLAPHVRSLGYHHVGVDLTTSALRQALDHGVTGVRGSVAALPMRDGAADVVCAGEILEHVEDLPGVLAECCRVLRPGGRLVIDTIADTAVARFLAIRVAELARRRLRGLHDPGLLVDRDVLVAECARHGVPLQLRGFRPAVGGTVRWLVGRRASGRMVPIGSTAVLFQAQGTKVAA